MQNTQQASKELKEAQYKIPTLLKNELIPQMKVRSNIHSGECKWFCAPQGYPCIYVC